MRENVLVRLKNPVSSAILRTTGIETDTLFLEKPGLPSHGDYSTNIAMIYAKKGKIDPLKLAGEIKKGVEASDRDGFFDRIDVAGPGFINFFVSERIINHLVNQLINTEEYLSFAEADAPPIIIEFVSANPTGPLHVGHGRGAAFGDALARILRFAGRRVTTEYYINDVGQQMEVLARSLYIRYLENRGIRADLPGDHYKGKYIRDLAGEVAEREGDKYVDKEDDGLSFFLDYGKGKILESIKMDLERFNVHFDSWFSERSLYDNDEVDRSVELLRERGYIYEKDGAVWFRSTTFGDDKDRVVVRANGQKTYFASDIAYHVNKGERGFAEMIDIWGADHHGYVPRLRAAFESFGMEEKTFKVILVQFVNLIKDGKTMSMSTREGRFETLREILDEVGCDAARFFYLMRNANSHLDFDLDLAKKESSDNPVYYVQYAHARICSILREANERGIELPVPLSVNGQEGGEEIGLMKKTLEFRDVVEDAAHFLEPHRIPFYLIELGKSFHSYYNRNRFITDDRVVTMKRLALAMGIKKVVSKGLELIGVSAPESM